MSSLVTTKPIYSGIKKKNNPMKMMIKGFFRTKFLMLYAASLPLTGIFMLDVLPSRLSLILLGHLSGNVHHFDALFLAYSFTNFFAVFILAFSCGLDTLNKAELRNSAYYRYAMSLVGCAVIIYLIAAIYSEAILIGLHQPLPIVSETSHCIQWLIPYALCFVMFSMIRKSLLKHLHAPVMIKLMIYRVLLHVLLSTILYFLRSSNNINSYIFAISDSCSMFVLLTMIIRAYSKKKDLKRFFQLFWNSDTVSSRQIMNPLKSCVIPVSASNPTVSTDSETEKEKNNPLKIQEDDDEKIRALRVNTTIEVDKDASLIKYLSHTWLPGGISCLEWWAVETFTFLVGGLQYPNDKTLVILFVHGCWNSLLIIFQMPALGLSVAMASLLTTYIQKGVYHTAWYTLLQAIGSMLIYSAILLSIVLALQGNMLNLFLPLKNAKEGGNNFLHEVRHNSLQITPLFIGCIVGYSMAMCFLGMFVSVGKLARGGLLMLISYYLIGLIIAVWTAYGLDWKLYGIWVGFCAAYMCWCILSLLHWTCKDSFRTMIKTKQLYDLRDPHTTIDVTPSADSTSSAHVTDTIKNYYGSTLSGKDDTLGYTETETDIIPSVNHITKTQRDIPMKSA